MSLVEVIYALMILIWIIGSITYYLYLREIKKINKK